MPTDDEQQPQHTQEAPSKEAPANPEPDTDQSATSPETTPETTPEVTPEATSEDEPAVGWWTRKFRAIESYVSRLSYRNNFWHRICSLFFLRLAFKSGIKLGQQKDGYYETVVPFSKFNKNWYNAMAGAALLANSEVAGGMYIFQYVGSDYTVVCKELHYKFRLPCQGPALYRVRPREDIETLMKENEEFNITVELDVIQAVKHKGERERRVGISTATFHVAPKSMFRARKAKLKQRKQGALKKT